MQYKEVIKMAKTASKTVNLNDMNDDIDKKFEKLSSAAARRIDNGGTRPKPKAKAKAKAKPAKKK